MMQFLNKNNHSRLLYLERYKEDDLSILTLTGYEGVSVPFEYKLVLELYNQSIDFNLMHGTSMACKIHDNTFSHPPRHVHGVITHVEQVVLSATNSIVTITLEPSIILLNIGCSLRTWSNKKAPDLVCELLKQYGITDVDVRLHKEYSVREFCMQYNETDYDFIMRLLEENGIYYYFTHDSDKHTFVLADHSKSHDIIADDSLVWKESIDEGRIDQVYNWTVTTSIIPTEVVCNGYNISQASSIVERCMSVREGKGVTNIISTRLLPIYSRAELQNKAKDIMYGYESNDAFIEIKSNAPWLASGLFFNLEVPNKNKKGYRIQHLVMEVKNNTEHMQGKYNAHCIVIENNINWQPLNTCPRTTISGFFSATVVGPESEEIHTDEYGRVSIRFEWQENNNSERNNSCWARVVQPWSGSRFGAQFLPRVGSEVLVSFLQGNPDHPVVVGSVFNGLNKPPYVLPENKSESGFVSHSTKDGAHNEGHQLTFNDKRGEEKLTILSQKDFIITVKNDRTSTVNGNSHETIEKNRTTQISKGTDTLTVKEGDLNLSIEKGNLQQVINGAMNIKIKGGNFNLVVNGGGGAVELDKILKISSNQSIELNVNSSKILLTPSGITISGPNVKIESTGVAEVKGSMTTLQGSGMTKIKGGMINIG